MEEEQMKKRILSVLLVVVMLVGMIPVSTVTVGATQTTTTASTATIASYEVDTWDELKTALTASGTAKIKLTADIKKKIEKKESGGLPDYENVQILVAGKKEFDLNGYSINVIDESNVKISNGDLCVGSWATGTWSYLEGVDRTLFTIPSGVSLTVTGNSNDKILYDAYVMDDFSFAEDKKFWEVTPYRNIFEVSGTLTINGGQFVAGSAHKKWVDLCHYMTDLYTGYAHRYVHGSAVHLKKGGTAVINGGTLYGHGQGPVPYCLNAASGVIAKAYNRDSVVEYPDGSSLVVNGGSFIGKGGANVFSGNGDITVRGGSFKTDKNDKELGLLLDPDEVEVPDGVDVPYSTGTKYTHPIYKGTYGNIGIPLRAYNKERFRMKIVVENKVYTNPDDIPFVKLDQTGGQDSGNSLDVSIMPYNDNYDMDLYFSGGPYDESCTSANEIIEWNHNSDDSLIASVKQPAYYSGVASNSNGYSLQYLWKIWTDAGAEVTVSPVDLEFYTNEPYIDVYGEAGIKGYHTGTLKVGCEVVEKLPTGNIFKYGTNGYIGISNTKTPLDETALPGNKMDINISYPNYSGLGSDIVIDVLPTVEELAKPAYGNSDVIYYYTYRDNQGYEEPIAWYKSTYQTSAMDWGHVPVNVEMRVQGSDGIIKRFNSSAWALKLPDIELSGGTWDSNKAIYVGIPNSAVTLTATIDSRYSTVPADSIVDSDITGWYKITYDSNGAPVYSYIGGAKTIFTLVTKNGTYCYAAKDRNGNTVYSKPVQVQFSSDAYSIQISKSNNYSFYVYNTTGATMQNVSLTATIGSSVKSSEVVWKVKSYPQGMPENAFKPWIMTTGTSKKFNELFSTSYKLKNIVPGDYTVQAYVYKDGRYISASNTVTVNVKRVAEYVDIIDESGKVISEQLLEGPYVGGTMKFGCVPGNGASNPEFKSVSWTVESLVGTDVATISNDGVLTAKKPGQVKVIATAIEANGDIQLHTDTQYAIINIPITEFEVTLDTPVVGGDPHKIASVPEDAPYRLDYNERYSWVSGVSGSTGLFAGNLIPQLSVELVPKEGYVLPARQLGLQDTVATDEWWTYSDDCIITVNGTKYNFKDFETTYTNGYTLDDEYGEFYEPQGIDFYWSWERLIDPSHTYINYVNLTTPIPKTTDSRDMTPDDEYVAMLPTCNTDSIFAWVNDGGVYKVSGDYLNDNDYTNDNAVRMEETETYQRGQVYRADIYFSTTNKNYTTYFAKNVTLVVNGETCHIEALSGGSNLEGQTNAKAYYYFTPIPERETISMVYIDGIEQPVGYTKPVTSIDVTVGDGTGEVYISRLKWFYDVNNNSKPDNGEDSASYFNKDGSFVPKRKYSVYVELEARDRDGDGESDYVIIPDDVGIFIANGNYIYKLTGDKNGAVYTFAETTTPEKAVMADTTRLVFDLPEGYGSTSKTITFTSVGTTKITSINAKSAEKNLVNVTSSGMKATVAPVNGLEKGRYSTYVQLFDENSNVLYTVPVTINVGNKNNTKGDVNGDGNINVSDVILVMKHIVSIIALDDVQSFYADINSDGKISVLDVLCIQKMVLDIEW